jgi:hypothetical protein
MLTYATEQSCIICTTVEVGCFELFNFATWYLVNNYFFVTMRASYIIVYCTVLDNNNNKLTGGFQPSAFFQSPTIDFWIRLK